MRIPYRPIVRNEISDIMTQLLMLLQHYFYLGLPTSTKAHSHCSGNSSSIDTRYYNLEGNFHPSKIFLANFNSKGGYLNKLRHQSQLFPNRFPQQVWIPSPNLKLCGLVEKSAGIVRSHCQMRTLNSTLVK